MDANPRVRHLRFQEINRLFDRECRSRVLSQTAEAKGHEVGLTHSMFAPSDFACIPPGFDHVGRSIKPCPIRAAA